MLFFIAKKQNVSKHKNYYINNKKNSKASNVLTFLGSILGGGVIGIITIYILQYKYPSNKNLTLINTTTKSSSNVKPKSTKTNLINRSEHNYDFYNILTSSSNNIDMKDRPTKHIYLLSLGDFNNITDADELKAKLALHGFEAKIENTISPSKKKHNYRVIIGPFDSENNAKQQKAKLSLAGFNNKLIKNH